MESVQIVIDTNVVIAALRTRTGPSFRLFSLIGRSKRFRIHLSVPLVFEYEEVARRQSRDLDLSDQDIGDVLDYLCSVGRLHDIYFLWRPVLKDPKDDLVLEIAVAGMCEGIVTYNKRDFAGAERFGLWLETPAEFLQRIGE